MKWLYYKAVIMFILQYILQELFLEYVVLGIHLSSLATVHRSHQVQDIDACVQYSHKLHTVLQTDFQHLGTVTEVQRHFPKNSHSLYLGGGMISPVLPRLPNTVYSRNSKNLFFFSEHLSVEVD